MVRKVLATTEPKGSQKDEPYMAGITGATDFIQQAGNPAGIKLDEAIQEASREIKPEEVMKVPMGGIAKKVPGQVNSK